MSNATETTQTVTYEPFADFLDKYGKADKSDKAKMRASAEKKAQGALAEGKPELALRWMATKAALKTDKPDIEVNHAQVVANALNVISAASEAIWTYATEHGITDESDLPDASDNADKADKLVKSLLSVRNESHSIQGVYERAFDGDEVGTVRRVSDICARGALDDYKPGSGAVAARLRGEGSNTLTDTCTLDGFEPVWVAKDGTVADSFGPGVVVGARKVA